MRVSRLKMIVIEKQKIIRSLVTLERSLILNDDFQELSIQRKIFSQIMLNDIMKNDSPSLDYCKKLLCLGTDIFTDFIDIITKTKRSDNVDLLLKTPPLTPPNVTCSVQNIN